METLKEVEIVVMKNTNEDPEQMASLNVAATHESAHSVGKLKGVVDQHKENMAQIKETLRK